MSKRSSMFFRFGGFTFFLSLLSFSGVLSDILPEDDCIAQIDTFLEKHLSHLQKGSTERQIQKYNPDDFLFFLHVPRTAGRSFWSCFLSRAYPNSRKCAKSYDGLRLELSRPDCKLLASHDDYSIVDFFPDNFQVITQARDPVDRVISTYEFSILISAREYHPNATYESTKSPSYSDKVKTRDVWPWLYLAQLFDRYIERTLSHHYAKYQKLKTGISAFCFHRNSFLLQNNRNNMKLSWINGYNRYHLSLAASISIIGERENQNGH